MPYTDPHLYLNQNKYTSTVSTAPSHVYHNNVRVVYAIEPRLDTPPNLNMDQFPHEWKRPNHVSWKSLINWCYNTLGPVDESWTWQTTGAVYVKEHHVIDQLNLTF